MCQIIHEQTTRLQVPSGRIDENPIAHLNEAINPHGHLVWSRVSGRSRRERSRLHEQTRRVTEAIDRLGGKVKEVCEVEGRGQLLGCMTRQRQAGELARKYGWTITATEWTRLFRPAHERYGEPKPEDYRSLMEVFGGALLATVESPYITQAKLRGQRIRQSPNRGRPSKTKVVTDEDILRLFVGPRIVNGQLRFATPAAEISRSLHLGKATVARLLDRMSPTGETWREYFTAQAQLEHQRKEQKWKRHLREIEEREAARERKQLEREAAEREQAERERAENEENDRVYYEAQERSQELLRLMEEEIMQKFAQRMLDARADCRCDGMTFPSIDGINVRCQTCGRIVDS